MMRLAQYICIVHPDDAFEVGTTIEYLYLYIMCIYLLLAKLIFT